jgi:hypothetical protein
MSRASTSQEEMKNSRRKRGRPPKTTRSDGQEAARPLASLQQRVGNRAVQRLLAQRSADGSGELDDETAGRINQKRGGGQPLDSGVQKKMTASTGEDFSQVKVHTDPEADTLNHQLGAKAFTTGQDVFFRDGAYQPQTSGGQELLAHELTHVIQQRQGAVSGGDRMQVNAPGDPFEQQADHVAHDITSGQPPAGVQRAAPEEEEEKEPVQTKPAEEEDQIQMAQRAAAPPEEEEPIQMKEEEEEEPLQRQEDEEDKEMTT